MRTPLDIVGAVPKVTYPSVSLGYLTPPRGVPAHLLADPLPASKIPNLPFARAINTLGAALILIDVIGRAGGYKWRDDLLAKIGRVNVSKPAQSSGVLGGQTEGVIYNIEITVVYKPTGETIPAFDIGSVEGAITGISSFEAPNAPNGDTSASGIEVRGKNGVVSWSGNSTFYRNAQIASIKRADGLTETPLPVPSTYPPVPSGYTPTSSPFKNDQDRRVGTSNPIQASTANGLLGAVGLSKPIPTTSLTQAPTRAPNPNPNPNPLPSTPLTPNPSSRPLPKEVPDKNKDKPKAPFNPLENKPEDLGQKISGLGAILALISANTSFDSLKNAAKTGSCETMKSPSCTKDMEDRIKNPLGDKIDGTTATIGTTLASQGTSLGLILDKLNDAKEFSEKVARAAKLDKLYNLLTFITVIHNAQMLSSSLSTTLMDALSLGLATFNIKDENDSPIDIQSIINKSAEQTVISIIGASNYADLSERWKKASTVYRSGMNMLYNMRSLWDSSKSLNEMTGANVGQLMNALRKDGVVSENAYPNKSESPQMVNGVMTKLENLDQAASALASITGETNSMVETVAQLNKDRQDFEKLVKESPKKAGTENDAAKAQSALEKTSSASPVITNTDLSKPEI